MNNNQKRVISKTIKDKQGRVFTVQVNPDSFNVSKGEEVPRWSIKYTVNDTDGDRFGFGSFTIKWHGEITEVLSDEEAFIELLGSGAQRVLADINQDHNVESCGYTINIGHR